MSAAETPGNRPATAADYLAILRRRKWIIITMPILTAAVAYLAAAQQSPLYKAVSQVRFVASPAGQLTETPSPTVGDPTFIPTQAAVAREQALAERIASAPGGPTISAGRFLSESDAIAEPDVNSLALSVTDPNPDVAVALANLYAKVFKTYKVDVDTTAIREQVRVFERAIKRLRARGNNTAADGLLDKKLALETQGNLLANNVRVSALAEGATKTRPKPRRAAILGGLLGAALALGLALLAEALDRRVRSEKEFEETLGFPLLGRLQRPSRRLQRDNMLVMLRDPTSIQAEAFRKLRTSIEFVNIERRAQTIMVTSPGPREGKSTTVANLAVAFAKAGKRVTLVDLDLRRPFLHNFFSATGEDGFTDVVVERLALEDAIRSVVLPPARAFRNANGSPSNDNGVSPENGRGKGEGVLHFLPAGTIPPSADEFLQNPRVAALLDELASRSDVVLVDAPPLLAVGDTQTLSAVVDGIVLIAHLGSHRRQLQELARQLPHYRADVLGFVLTGVSHADSYTYGYGYDPHVYSARPETRRRGQRV